MPLNKRRKGAAIVEFALASMILVPLFFGTLALGLNLGRSIQVTQISRDIAVLYSRGVDFSKPAGQALAQRLGSGVDLTPNGNGVVILSQAMVVQHDDCVAGGHSNGCANEGVPVFLNRLVIGNSSLRASRYERLPA